MITCMDSSVRRGGGGVLEHPKHHAGYATAIPN